MPRQRRLPRHAFFRMPFAAAGRDLSSLAGFAYASERQWRHRCHSERDRSPLPVPENNELETNLTGAQLSTSADRNLNTSCQLDSQTRLQLNRVRYYDPKAGRWASQDPIGFDAGDANLYRYIGNNSTNLTDPTGLKSKQEWVDQANASGISRARE